jgi:serine/threonine protein kinase
MPGDAFIAYASKDKVVADAICNRLENRRVRCWIAPRDLAMDGRHGKNIDDILERCSLAILVLSLDMVFSEDEKRIIEKTSARSIPLLTYWIGSELVKYLRDNNGQDGHWLDFMDEGRDVSLDRFIDMAAKVVAGVSRDAADDKSTITEPTILDNTGLEPGQMVYSASGRAFKIERSIGQGAQGRIYEARSPVEIKAVKWFDLKLATEDRKNVILSLIAYGSPDDQFIWPEDIVQSPDNPGFGYLMRMIEPGFVSINDMLGHNEKMIFSKLTTIGINIVSCMESLHSKGLCYSDISPANIFYNAGTGDVRICDNDNVAADGDAKSVLGTPRFMAPEIVRRKAGPSINTDKYSLAVLLFYIFFRGHPLVGRMTIDVDLHDKSSTKRFFGSEPRFIFDPDDNSNRPVPGKHDNPIMLWGIYPKFFRDAFTRAFNDNIRNPGIERVSENDWALTLMRMRESVFHCKACGAENFYDIDLLKANRGKPGLCWSCGKMLELPPRIRLDGHIVTLEDGFILYRYGKNGLPDISRPLAQIQGKGGRLDIMNISPDKWAVCSSDGSQSEVLPGGNIRASGGMKIEFGNIEGEIRV